jgi:hypothetical protein
MYQSQKNHKMSQEFLETNFRTQAITRTKNRHPRKAGIQRKKLSNLFFSLVNRATGQPRCNSYPIRRKWTSFHCLPISNELYLESLAHARETHSKDENDKGRQDEQMANRMNEVISLTLSIFLNNSIRVPANFCKIIWMIFLKVISFSVNNLSLYCFHNLSIESSQKIQSSLAIKQMSWKVTNLTEQRIHIKYSKARLWNSV